MLNEELKMNNEKVKVTSLPKIDEIQNLLFHFLFFIINFSFL